MKELEKLCMRFLPNARRTGLGQLLLRAPSSRSAMTEIDKPFRLTPRFAVVWGLLAAPVAFLAFRYYDGPAYQKVALTIVGSLYATFCFYGPILLARQAAKSGGRGWFVLQVAVTVVLGVGLLFAVIAFANHGAVPDGAVALVTFLVFFNLNRWLRHGPRA